MLVLTREESQVIMIGDDIEVTVVEIRGKKVRIGIKAPDGVSIHRLEVWLEVKAENSAQVSPVV